jgi:hypothetical protein
MNSLEEINNYVDYIKSIDINDSNIDELKKFIRFSPEKQADKLNIDRVTLTKEFDKHKKEIHNKILIYEKIKILSKRRLTPSIFKYGGKDYNKKICICNNYFVINYDHTKLKFYPTIRYYYFEDVFTESDIIYIFHDTKKVHATRKEFEENFQDLRDYTIERILN